MNRTIAAPPSARIRRHPANGLALGAVLFCAFLIPAAAQTLSAPSPQALTPATADIERLDTNPASDRKDVSTLGQFNRWKARMKNEHFTAYLSTYTAIVACFVGLIFGFGAYRLSDPMSSFRHNQRRSLQLAAAIGGTLGLLTAVMQVPAQTTGKVSLLFMAIGTGAATTMFATCLAFLILRFRSKRAGRPVPRHPGHA